MDVEKGKETIRRVLSAYELGPKLRQLRLRKKVGLKDLGVHTGLSSSLLSQLENGKLVPTLQILARIAMVFDVSLEHFFSDRRPKRLFAVVRAGERIRFPERPDMPSPTYFFECLAYPAQGKGLQAYLAEFPGRPGKSRKSTSTRAMSFFMWWMARSCFTIRPRTTRSASETALTSIPRSRTATGV